MCGGTCLCSYNLGVPSQMSEFWQLQDSGECMACMSCSSMLVTLFEWDKQVAFSTSLSAGCTCVLPCAGDGSWRPGGQVLQQQGQPCYSV